MVNALVTEVAKEKYIFFTYFISIIFSHFNALYYFNILIVLFFYVLLRISENKIEYEKKDCLLHRYKITRKNNRLRKLGSSKEKLYEKNYFLLNLLAYSFI